MKKEKFLEKECLYCKEKFLADRRELNRGNARYCSKRCGYDDRINLVKIPEPKVECAHCGFKFYKTKSKSLKSKSGLYFCCNEHKNISQRIGGIKEILPAHYGTAKTDNPYYYRNVAFSSKPKICERCDYSANEKAIIVHHKDRNRENASPENLEVLCCNCHVLEHFKGLKQKKKHYVSRKCLNFCI